VEKNDQISVHRIEQLAPAGILISPGPGRPEDAGVSEEIVRALGDKIPILGVCLGHQAIAHVFGGEIVHAPTLMHGKTSVIHHDGSAIYEGVEQDFIATRYHSLVVAPATVPKQFKVTATTADGVVMGIRHRIRPIEGVQFHPESILTTEGPKLIRNWTRACLERDAAAPKRKGQGI
jgi:anthranilate synthase component 2